MIKPSFTPATLSDIAARLGISKMTVSRAMSQSKMHQVTLSLREQIHAVAKELNYRPNTTAQALTRRRSFTIGVLQSAGNTRVVPLLSRGLQDVLASEGFAPIVYIHGDLAEEARFLDQCLLRGVEGLIVNIQSGSDGMPHVEPFAQLRDDGFPIVEMNGTFLDGVPHVTADYFGGSKSLTEQLITAGHKRIVHFANDLYRIHETRPGYFWTMNAVWRGYTEAMQQAGLEPKVVTFPTGHFRLQDAMQLIDDPSNIPTAVVCGGMRTAEMLSYFITTTPAARGMKAAFYGDVEDPSPVLPDALRIHFPGFQIGQTAARLLLGKLKLEEVGDVVI